MYCDNSRFIHWNTIYNHTSHLNWSLLTRWHNMFYPIFVCYGSTTSRPYPARSLPARIWHRCTDEVFVWAPTQPIIDKDLAEPRFEPGSPSWESDALTTTPQAFAFPRLILGIFHIWRHSICNGPRILCRPWASADFFPGEAKNILFA